MFDKIKMAGANVLLCQKGIDDMVQHYLSRSAILAVRRVKAHDNRRNFNLLNRLNVEPVIAIRKNASTRARGCQLRREEVLLLKKLGYQRWKQIKDAGTRWIAEIVFSSIKRVLGEDLFSKKFSAQKVEGGLKIMLYNKFIAL